MPRRNTAFLVGVNASSRYSKWPVFSCPLMAAFGCPPRAFRDEGFEVKWANENDQFAVQTYECNFPETKLHAKSIEHLSAVADRLSHVDVMTGGFPCQPFSVAGSKEGFADRRGRLFFEIVRLLAELGPERPKILLLENVPYLVNHDRGRTFPTSIVAHTPLLRHADVVVAVPPDPERYSRRGMSLPDNLAAGVERQLALPWPLEALVKTKSVELRGLQWAERRKAIQGSMEIRDASLVKDRCVSAG
jgi:hypothetical protein